MNQLKCSGIEQLCWQSPQPHPPHPTTKAPHSVTNFKGNLRPHGHRARRAVAVPRELGLPCILAQHVAHPTLSHKLNTTPTILTSSINLGCCEFAASYQGSAKHISITGWGLPFEDHAPTLLEEVQNPQGHLFPGFHEHTKQNKTTTEDVVHTALAVDIAVREPTHSLGRGVLCILARHPQASLGTSLELVRDIGRQRRRAPETQLGCSLGCGCGLAAPQSGFEL